MRARSNYNTKQKEILIDYLKSLKGKHVSVNEIKDYINQKGLSVGLTTIYRQLEKLVEEHLVAKITLDASTSSLYEYIGDEHLHDSDECYHLRCEVCNKIIHFHCHELSHVKQHMYSEHGFQINYTKTIFYGICDKCLAL